MNKSKKVWRFVVVLAMVASGFAAMASADITSENNAKSSSAIIYVPDNYTKIQWAVDNATDGDTIIVRNGTYTENVKVNKRLTIKSEKGSANCIVKAATPNNVFHVSADYVNISEFTLEGCVVNMGGVGINLYASHCTIFNNKFLNTGLFVFDSHQNTVENNTVNGKPLVYLEGASDYTIQYAGQVVLVKCNNIIVKNLDLSNTAGSVILREADSCNIENNDISASESGICLVYSSNNTLRNNNLSNNVHGIYLSHSCKNFLIKNNILSSFGSGISLSWSSNNNLITDNKVSNGGCNGVVLGFSNNNTLTNNNISKNDYGICLSYSNNNFIYLNNFIDNIYFNARSVDSNNSWNSTEKISYVWKGKAQKNYTGNYWSDYKGSDLNEDGIGDAPYSIDSDKDNYPLMEPWENYFAPTEPRVQFIDSGQSLGDSMTRDVFLGDIDKDGDIDFVAGNSHYQSNKIYINNGAGIFSDSGHNLGSSGTYGVALGDVDNDGDLDLVVANYAYPNQVYMNDGSGVFVDSGQLLGGSSYFTFSVALGDIDNDGDLDFIAGNTGQGGAGHENKVYVNDGAVIFSDSGQSLGSSATSSVALGDIDNDGDLDLVVGNKNFEANKVYLNDGTGIFTDSGQNLGFSMTNVIVLGDVNNDGNLDLIAGNSDPDATTVWLNDGAGIFTDSGQNLGLPHTILSLSLGDVDNDEDLDLVQGSRNPSGGGYPNKVYLNDGTGIFTDSGENLGCSWTESVALGDIDGDGDLDLVAGNAEYGLDANKVYINQYVAPPPSEVWIDDDWAGSSPGNVVDGHIFGTDAFAKIQGGIDAVASPGTVHVAAGTYYENINLRDRIKVLGAGADVTTIDGGGFGPVVEGADGATIAGFTIVNSSNEGIKCYFSSPYIEDNAILGHNVGIWCEQSAAEIAVNTLKDNNNGVYICDNSSPRVEANVIVDNLYGIVSRSSSPTIIQNQFLRSHIDFEYASDGTVVNNLIIDGSSGIRIFSSSSPGIINNVIMGATSESGIVISASSPLITNNIIVDNNIGIDCQYGSGTPILSHNDVWGNMHGDYIAGCTPGAGDISEEPLFADPANGSYHLQAGSPCIDTGNNTGAPSTDFDDNPRPIDGDCDEIAVVDMGAFEFIPLIFDTGKGTYPSIMGTHTGTIKPYHDINVSRMYTYPCAGTGGHSESVRIYGNGINVNGTWNGYTKDWHNITFNESFTLKAGEIYNYTIRTGSYLQIIHKQNHTTLDGSLITCEEFIDVNGRKYNGWIPAIMLE